MAVDSHSPWRTLPGLAASVGAGAFAGASFLVALPTALAATCTHPQGNVEMPVYGDINGSGAVNVADALCSVLCVLADSIQQATPPCVAPTLAATRGDADCDGEVEVGDVVVIVTAALGADFGEAIDQGGDGCPDACESCASEGGSSCLIDGACVPEGALHPTVDCQACVPISSTIAWSEAADASPCGLAGMLCQSGACIDPEPPPPPALTAPASNPLISAADLLQIEGTCEVGATVFMTGAESGSTSCEDGTFAFGLERTTDDTYVLAFTQQDQAGNASASVDFTWTRDTVPPDAPGITTPSPLSVTTNTSQLTIAGTCTDTFTVAVAGSSTEATTCAGGAFSFEVEAAADGLHTYVLRQIKPTTLVESATATVAWLRDTAAPEAPTITAPSANPYYSGGSEVTLAGECAEGTLVHLGGDEEESMACDEGEYSFSLVRTSNGAYDFALSQQDAAGNTSPATPFQWVRDDSVPTPPLVLSPASSPWASTDSLLTLSGSCTTDFYVYLQGASTQTQACADGEFSFDVAADVDGDYAYSLYQQSHLTGIESATTPFTWRRDTMAPDEVTVTSPPANPYFSGDDTIAIAGACEVGATVDLSGAETASALCTDGSYSFSVTRLSNTTYNFNLVQTDKAGNASLPLLFQWVRDNTIPPTPMVTSPSSPHHSATPTLTITGTCLSTYEVTLAGDDSQVVTCVGGAFSFLVSEGADGFYAYQLHQTNPLTFIESSATAVLWGRDTVAPSAVVITAPSTNPYYSGDTTFALQGTCEAGATVSLTGAQTGTDPCAAGTFRFDLSKSTNGTYNYSLSQKDLANNASPSTAFQWVRDTSIPPTPVLSSPPSNPYTSNGSSLTIAGSCSGTNTVHVSGANTGSATCTGGAFSFTFTKTTDGVYNYSITQQSSINQQHSSAVSLAWTRDTVAPGAPTPTSVSPLSPAANANPKFKGTVASGTATVQLFKNTSCTGSPAATGTAATFTGAGIAVAATLQASMQVAARAVDTAGNTSGCSAANIAYVHRAAQLIEDINVAGSGSSSPTQFGVVGSKVFFRATNGLVGSELWATNGTAAGTYMVKDINAADSSNPLNIVDFNGIAVFAADDGESGSELWRSDGTEAGTWLIADINPGAFGSAPANFLAVGTTLYFSADDGDNGVELWKTDGTDAGTVLVKDINPGFASSSPTQLKSVGSRVVFRATDDASGIELWTTNGTSSGTTIFDINPGTASSSPNYLINMGTYVYFSATEATTGNELWRTTGTAVERLTDLYASTTSSSPAYLAVAGSTLFFYARQSSPTTSYELFKYTTAGGAVLVKDIYPGGASTQASSPTNIRAISSTKVVFRALTAAGGQEPWVSDGTEAGTFQLADINPGVANSVMGVPVVAGGRAYFAATTSGEVELWATDGTVTGTVKYDINPDTQSSSPGSITAFGSSVIFSALHLATGVEPRLASATGVTLLADLNPIPSSSPTSFVQLGTALLFAADDGANGRELWKSDGTAAGTVLVKDINADPGAHSSPTLLTVAGSYVFFRADDGIHGAELWRTDGTTAGTVMVTDIAPDELPSTPASLLALGTKVLFSADDGTGGIELWQASGTGAATLVKDIYAGASSSSPSQFAVMGTKLYFRATDATNGAELWATDGTTAGTVLVKNIRSGSSSSSPTAITVVGGNKLYFSANDGTTGAELHVSDGTAANTYRVADLYAGTPSSSPGNFRDLGGTLIFAATEATYGRELYKVTGSIGSLTLALVKDIRTGPSSSNPGAALILGTKAYFAAADDTAGNELWETTGTTAGTVRLLDARAGAAGSNPANFTAIDSTSFLYTANDGVNGTEPWRSDRTATGTYLVQDINLLGPSWGGAILTINGVVYFSASNGTGGVELWKY